MLQANDTIGRYAIQRRLGHGGMGTLYLAHDPVLDRAVALKLFLGDIELPGARERFVREARSAAALSNPNIVTVYDYGDYESQPYIVMEYIHGETLADVIRRKPDLPVSGKLRWMEELCRAVGYAHHSGIIHRDIKPANLMVDSYGRLKVLDFGIARMRGTLVSNATALVGTPGYCAPEQLQGGEIDHRSDLFSIGVVCYELLAYAEAFSGETVHVITNRILTEDPPPLAQRCRGVDAELAAVVTQALQKPADARFQSADALREALAAVRGRLEADSDVGVTTIGYVSPWAASSPKGGKFRAPLATAAADATALSHRTKGTPGATAPQDPRRTEREIVARRRVEQIQQHLTTAREHLQAGNVLDAGRACDRALALDDVHPEVLELLATINTRREQAASDLLNQARTFLKAGDAAAVEDRLAQLAAIDPDHADAVSVERELRVMRADQDRVRRRARALAAAIEAAEDALERGDLQEALVQSREVLELDPHSARGRMLEEEALQGRDRTQLSRRRPKTDPAPATPTPAAPGGDAALLRSTPPHAVPSPTPPDAVPPPTPPVPAPQSATPRSVPAPHAVPRPMPPRPVAPSATPHSVPAPLAARVRAGSARWRALPRGLRWAVLASAATLLLLVAAAIVRPLLRADVTPSLVVIDALPWAEVVAIERESGEREPLAAGAATPLALRLAPGLYRVTVAGPPPQSERRVITLRVEPDAPGQFPMQKFAPMTADKYFEPLLSPAAPAVESAAPVAAATQ